MHERAAASMVISRSDAGQSPPPEVRPEIANVVLTREPRRLCFAASTTAWRALESFVRLWLEAFCAEIHNSRRGFRAIPSSRRGMIKKLVDMFGQGPLAFSVVRQGIRVVFGGFYRVIRCHWWSPFCKRVVSVQIWAVVKLGIRPGAR
jgi:hypothetical protein